MSLSFENQNFLTFEHNSIVSPCRVHTYDHSDDGNGEIDHDELLQYLMQMDKKTTARAVKMLIRSADKDHNGTIDREEWGIMVSKLYA